MLFCLSIENIKGFFSLLIYWLIEAISVRPTCIILSMCYVVKRLGLVKREALNKSNYIINIFFWTKVNNKSTF